MGEKKQRRKIRRLLSLFLAVMLMAGLLPAESIFALENESAMEAEENAETELSEVTEPVTEAGQDTDLEPAPLEQPAETETPTPNTEPEPDGEPEENGEVTYTNSISGLLWYDANEDGVKDNGESLIANYPVSLYRAEDIDSAVQTVITNANGGYEFSNIEPGNYVVGIKAEENGTEYLLPLLGVQNNNKFYFASDYSMVISNPIDIGIDTAVTDINAGMRTSPAIQPLALGAVDYLIHNQIYVVPGQGYRFSVAAIAKTATSVVSQINSDISVDNVRKVYAVLATDAQFTSTSIMSTTLVYSQETSNGSSYDLNFSVNYSGLTPGATYYIKFQVTDRFDSTIIDTTNYKGEKNYFVLSIPLPTATTGTANTVTTETAQIAGTFNTFGGTLSMGQIWYSANEANLAEGSSTHSTKGWFGAGDYILNGNNGTVSTSLSGLTPNTTYYYRMVMTVSGKTVYGDILSFKTLPLAPTTNAPTFSNVTSTTADVAATYSLNGGTVSSLYFLYGTTASPMSNATAWTPWSTTSATGSMSGLSPNTRYYVRNYISTNGGSIYSADGTFVTKPAFNIWGAAATDQTTAVVSGSFVASLNSQNITGVTVIYATSNTFASPTTITLTSGALIDGFTNTSFTANLTGLSAGITYYVKVEVTNAGGTTASTVDTFTTLPLAPTANTPTFSNVTSTTADVAATYSLNGGTVSSLYYFYATTASPMINATAWTPWTTTSATGYMSGLTPNTRYYVRNYISTNGGSIYSADGTFVTLPGFSWTPTAINTTTGDVTGVISTSLNGENITSVRVWYDTATITSLSPYIDLVYDGVGAAGGTFSNTAFHADLMGLSMTGTTVYNIQVDVTNAGGTTTSTKQISLANYTVTEKFVDESTGTSFQSNNPVSVPMASPNYTFGGFMTNIIVGTDEYVYAGYKVGSYTAGDTLDGTGTPAITGLTSDEDIYLVYHKLNNNIGVTIPTGMEFYVDQTTNRDVYAGTIGSGGGEYYLFENYSDKPVDMEFTGMTVNAATSVNLSVVSDAATSMATNPLHLDILLATSSNSNLTAGTTNGFAGSGVNNIAPGSAYTTSLGTLDGQYVQQTAPTDTKGYITLGGYYGGMLATAAKNADLTFIFTYDLVP